MGHEFHTSSDTEVLLVAYRAWGERLVPRLRGMFAFVLYDHSDASLFAARDRFGKKPLLYWADSGKFAFASEAKALLRLPGIDKAVDPIAITAYLDQLYVPEHRSVFRSLRKLPPGHTLRWRDSTVSTGAYWTPSFTVDGSLGYEEALELLDAALRESVRIRMRADVPVGVFLSGGIDSSLVASTAALVAGADLKTYTVRIAGLHDESGEAETVARHIGSHHTLIDVDRPHAARIIGVLESFDEPFADSSAVPMSLISEVAKEHVTVVLSGDGGDELFAGYGSYARYAGAIYAGKTLSKARFSTRLRALRELLPIPVERLLRRAIPDVSGLAIRRRAPGVSDILDRHTEAGRIHYEPAISRLVRPQLQSTIGIGAAEQRSMVTATDDALNRAFEYDVRHYLPGDILKKVDMTTMAWALEARAPLLDTEVASIAMRMSPRYKIVNGETKKPLRDLLSRRLGRDADALIARSKTGFGAPVSSWLREPAMADAVRDILLDSSLRSADWVDTGAVREIVRRFVSGRDYLGQPVWSLLALEIWARKYLGPR